MAEWREGTPCQVKDMRWRRCQPLSATVESVSEDRVTARLLTNGAVWGFDHEGRSLWDGEARWRLLPVTGEEAGTPAGEDKL